jgi:hypothetical protein
MFWIKNKKVNRVIKVILKSFLVILALIAIKIIINVYPEMFFWYSVKYKNFSIHSTQVIDNRIYKILDKATINLTTYNVNDTNVVYKIYLCQSPALYYVLIIPFTRRSIAFTFPHTKMIFISDVDVLTNRANILDADDPRTLCKVITHEITHTYQEKIFEEATFPVVGVAGWKTEGFCDMVGYNDTLDIMKVKEFIKNHKGSILTFSDLHMEYYYAVFYLYHFEKMNFEDILKSKLTLSEVLDKFEKRE